MGIWPRFGQVSVEQGSNVVSGTLTTWAGSGVQPGNPIYINGGVRAYEIAALDVDTPNTKLTLVENFEEDTVVNGTYRIVPFLGDRTPMAVNLFKQQAALVAGQTDVIETVGMPDPTIAATNVTGKLIAFDPTNRAYYYTQDRVWNGPVALGGADGADAGFKLAFSNLTATNADPGSGKFRLNNATLTAVTQIAVDDASADLGNPDISAYIASWVASTSSVKGTIIVRDVAQPNVFATFALAGLTDQAGYTQLNVTHIASHGAFADGHTFSVAFIRNGDKGDTGTAGVNAGFTMTLDRSTVVMGDPGAAKARFDNASLNATNNIALDDTSAETGNPSVAASIARWAVSTNAVKGKLHIRKVGAPQNFAIFDVMSVTPQTGWTEIGVAFEATGGALATNDVCAFAFVPAGDEGTDGVDGTTSGFAFTFDTMIGMADPGTGKLRFDNATLSSVSNIAIDDQSAASGNPDVSASILSWDASTNANMRGTLRITKKGHEEVYAEFAINGGTVDNVGWSKLAVSLISSAGTFANGDPVYVSATRAGDKGLDGDGAGDVIGPAGASDGNIVSFDTSTGKRIKDTGVAISTDPTFAANSDNLLPTQAAVGAYLNSQIAAQIAASDVEVLKGGLNCSSNPNYPAADAGHVYRVTVAGKIGGASGPNVEVGDRLECFVDGSASGTHASVGANWLISQVNIDGAVVGPAASTSGNLVSFSGTSGKVIQDTGLPLSTLRKGPTKQIFTSSGTWTKPAGCVKIEAEIIGGGGPGGGATATGASTVSGGSGGGTGGRTITSLDVTAISSLTVTVGAAGVAAAGTTGTQGGTSGLGTANANGQATGGLSGNVFSSTSGAGSDVNGGAPGLGSNGTINLSGAPGDPAVGVQGLFKQVGAGGTTPYGGGGLPASTSGNGSAPTAGYGAGGGGALNLTNQATARSGGNGAPGVVIITEYYA